MESLSEVNTRLNNNYVYVANFHLHGLCSAIGWSLKYASKRKMSATDRKMLDIVGAIMELLPSVSIIISAQ